MTNLRPWYFSSCLLVPTVYSSLPTVVSYNAMAASCELLWDVGSSFTQNILEELVFDPCAWKWYIKAYHDMYIYIFSSWYIFVSLYTHMHYASTVFKHSHVRSWSHVKRYGRAPVPQSLPCKQHQCWGGSACGLTPWMFWSPWWQRVSKWAQCCATPPSVPVRQEVPGVILRHL